jgi:kynurenine formamidase
MLYDLSQPTFQGAPHWAPYDQISIQLFETSEINGANVERVDLTTHSGTHLDAPFHFINGAAKVDELPLEYFTGPCIALDVRDLDHLKIEASDLEERLPHDISNIFVLLRTGWAEKRGRSRQFQMEFPFLSEGAAQLLVKRGIKGVGTECLSIGGYAPGESAPAHLVLLGAKKLIVEDMRIPDALLDGKRRVFAAFPIKLAGCGGAWTRAVALGCR